MRKLELRKWRVGDGMPGQDEELGGTEIRRGRTGRTNAGGYLEEDENASTKLGETSGGSKSQERTLHGLAVSGFWICAKKMWLEIRSFYINWCFYLVIIQVVESVNSLRTLNAKEINLKQ